MAEVYKRLNAAALTDTYEHILYVAPTSAQTLISNITVTNRSSSATSFDVNVYQSGKTQENFNNFKFSNLATNGTSMNVSTNGITWTNSSITPTYFKAMIYDSVNNKYVGVGYNAGTSTDGITWTTSNTVINAAGWFTLKYGNGIYVSTKQNTNSSAYSTNGVAWTLRSLPSSASWFALAFGNGVFVAVTTDYLSTAAASSTDGITWTARSTTSPSSYWLDIEYGAGKFVAVGGGGYPASQTSYSTNGISWTMGYMPSMSDYYSVAYGSNVFVAVGYGIGAISTNGVTWTSLSVPPGFGVSISSSQGKFIVSSGTSVMHSTNGITWTISTLPSPTPSGKTSTYVETLLTSPKLNNLYKNFSIDGNDTKILEPGIVLQGDASILIKDNSGGNLTFSTYGVELS